MFKIFLKAKDLCVKIFEFNQSCLDAKFFSNQMCLFIYANQIELKRVLFMKKECEIYSSPKISFKIAQNSYEKMIIESNILFLSNKIIKFVNLI